MLQYEICNNTFNTLTHCKYIDILGWALGRSNKFKQLSSWPVSVMKFLMDICCGPWKDQHQNHCIDIAHIYNHLLMFQKHIWKDCISTNIVWWPPGSRWDNIAQCPLWWSQEQELVLLVSQDRTEMIGRSERSWLQHTESLVAAHTAAQKSQSAGSKTEQAQEEGDASNQEQQRNSCLSGWLLSGSGKALDTFLCPLHESGLVEGKIDGGIEVVLDEESQRWVSWASWGQVRDRTWTGSDHNKEY